MKKSKLLINAFLYGFYLILFPTVSGVIASVMKLSGNNSRWLQGTFFLLSLILPVIMVACKKWKPREIGFGKPDKDGFKAAFFFLPILVISIPAVVKGFSIKSTEYLLSNLYLFIFVGLAEEIFFRGIIPGILSKSFNKLQVIALSSVLFVFDHVIGALDGRGTFATVLTIVNAFVFGWMAIEMTLLAGTLLPVAFVHFLFDFETKVCLLTEKQLVLADSARFILMALIAIWLFLVLKKNGKLSDGKKSKEERMAQ